MKGQALAEAATRLRPDLSVLFTTGYTVNDVVHRGMLKPGDDLLNKPFTLLQLATGLRNALERGPAVEDA